MVVFERTASLFEMNTLRNRILRGVSWSGFTAVAGRGATFAGTVVIARILSKSDFGTLTLIQSTIGMLGVIGSFGVGLTATRAVAENRSLNKPEAGRAAWLALVTSASCGTIATILAVSIGVLGGVGQGDQGQGTEILLTVAAPQLLFGAVTGAIVGILTGLERFKATAAIGVTTGVVVGGAACVGAALGGLLGAILGATFATGTMLLLAAQLLARGFAEEDVPLVRQIGLPQLRSLRDASLPIFLSAAGLWPVLWLGNVWLVKQPRGSTLLADFAVANQWRTALSLLPGILLGGVLPMLTNLRGSGRHREARRLFSSLLALNGAISIVGGTTAIVAGAGMLRLFGTSYSSAATPLKVLGLVVMIETVGVTLGYNLISLGRLWAHAGLFALWALGFLVTARWAIPLYGATGLAWAHLIAQVLYVVGHGVYLERVPSARWTANEG